MQNQQDDRGVLEKSERLCMCEGEQRDGQSKDKSGQIEVVYERFGIDHLYGVCDRKQADTEHVDHLWHGWQLLTN